MGRDAVEAAAEVVSSVGAVPAAEQVAKTAVASDGTAPDQCYPVASFLVSSSNLAPIPAPFFMAITVGTWSRL